MTHDFISYSRSNVTFADSLFHHLKQHQRNPWLDIRRLVPGQPWWEQLEQAVANAERLLLVVSPQALSSKNVEYEWTTARALNKPIILLIYEATPLPAELAGYEWIDFRGNFDKALHKLLERLNAPDAFLPIPPLPVSGFNMPPTLHWLTIGVSLVAINGILGLEYPLTVISNVLTGTETGVMTPLDWVGFSLLYAIPIIIIVRLISFPLQYPRRTYRFYDIENALFLAALLHPFMVPGFIPAFFIPLQILAGYQFDQPIQLLIALFIVFARAGFAFGLAALCWAVFRFSPPTYRWAGDEGINLVNREEQIEEQPQLPRQITHIQLIYAQEDSVIGDDMVREFREYGHQVDVAHPDTFQPSEAPLVLILVSRYNPLQFSEAANQTVIPVIIESVDIPDALARRQWLDLRRGLPDKMTATLASLLAYPDILVERVGVIPTKLATLRPIVVNSLLTALHLTIGFHTFWLIGAILTGLAGYRLAGPGCYFLGHLAIIGLAWNSRTMVIKRRGNQLHLLRNAVLILMLSWLFHICGMWLVQIPNEIYMKPDGTMAGTGALSLISIHGNEGFFLAQLLPLIIVACSAGAGVRRWLPKSRVEAAINTPASVTVNA
ncbi:MAG: toll/interleukin-1 receptor domain-containing protein [Anaerolineae bacterium]|nr:toll/interleukin-1 receptor domain-containing protein [Anaerolineae bacterium]